MRLKYNLTPALTLPKQQASKQPQACSLLSVLLRWPPHLMDFLCVGVQSW